MSNEQQFIPLAPLLTTLGVMLTLSLIVERFLSVVSWIIDRLSIIKSSTEWEFPEVQKKKLELAKRAKEEESILNPKVNNSVNLAKDHREIEPNPLYSTVDSYFDIKTYVLPDTVQVIREYWLQIIGVLVYQLSP